MSVTLDPRWERDDMSLEQLNKFLQDIQRLQLRERQRHLQRAGDRDTDDLLRRLHLEPYSTLNSQYRQQFGIWQSYHNPNNWLIPHFQDTSVANVLQEYNARQVPVVETGDGQSHAWGVATSGWVVGAILLAVLVLLVRAAEKCLDKKFFSMRRPSQEWARPNVVATRNDITVDVESSLRAEGHGRADPPPPYCKVGPLREEPPPPYSACHVTIISPKDGIPAVHYHRRRQNERIDAGDRSDNDEVQSEEAVAMNCEGDNSEASEAAVNCEGDNSAGPDAPTDDVDASVTEVVIVDETNQRTCEVKL